MNFPPLIQVVLVFTIFMFVVVMPIGIYSTLKNERRRKQIAERGIQSLGGKCPLCGGKMKPRDLFRVNSLWKIGAARCTKCKHLEIFSEEP